MPKEIAVLDDKDSNLEMISDSLSGMPVKIKSFRTVGSFLTYYSRKSSKLPALAILDYFVDGSDGYPSGLGTEAAKWLSENDRQVSVIGYSSVEACSRKIAEQGNGYVSLKKPKDAPDPNLRSAVREILGLPAHDDIQQ